MIIDNMVNMPTMQEPDIRIKKKNELEDQRPIEESEKSNDLELNFREDRPEAVKTAADAPEKRDESAGETYNEAGRLSSETQAKQEADPKNRSIDMIV